MDTILDTLVKRQQEQMAGDTIDAVKDIDPTALVESSESHGGGTLWDVKPPDPALMAVLSPQPTARSTASKASRATRGSRYSRMSRASSRRSVRSERSTRSGVASRGDTRQNLLRTTTKSAALRATGAVGPPPTADTDASRGTTPLDARSTVSRASTRSRRTNKSAAGTQPNDTVFDLQCRTKEFVAKTATEKQALDEVKQQIRETMKRIDHYQKELGGVLALRNNDNNVARQVDIMERRIVKSQNQYMDTIARNNQLRTEVNIWRREILFLKKANSSIRADMKRLEDGNHALEQSMKEMQQQHKQIEDEEEAISAMMEMEEEVLREKWEAMDADPSGLQMTLPTMDEVDVDRAGSLTVKDEAEMRSNVNSAAWQIGTSATMLEVAQKERPSAKALFSVVSQQTGLETPEEFSDKYLRIEAMNYALYRRVDHLIAEGRELKQQLNEMRRQKERVAKLVQGEDEVRHNALTSVDKAIQGVKERLEAQRSSYETATHAAHAIRTSLNRMMDMLGAGDLDSEVANGNLMTYFGVFEQRFRDLMLKYITAFFEPELATAKRKANKRHHRDRARAERLGMAQRYLGQTDVTLAHLHKTAVQNRNTAPIINPAAFAIGPSVPAGGMNKTLTSVSIPSVDGPKDNKQMAAFVRPWQMTTPITPGGAHTLVGDSSEFPGLDDTGVDRDSGEQDNGSTGESLPHIEEMFGDRPVSVPVGKVRNRRASGHAPVSPMVHSASGQWNNDSRAATAPAKGTGGGAPASLPQVPGASR